MSRTTMSGTSMCLLCSQRLSRPVPLFKNPNRIAGAAWLQSRTMAQAQKRTPSRKILSGSVSESPAMQSLKRASQKTAGPFAAMNQRETRVRGPPPKTTHRSRPRNDSRKDPRKDPRASTQSKGRSTGGRASGDFKALKMQRALSQVPYAERTSVKKRIGEVASFDQLSLLPAVRDAVYKQALEGLENVMPTPIQRLAIPTLLQASGFPHKLGERKGEMKQFLLAAETGSGKTLAYLLPTIDWIKRAEAHEAETKRQEEEQRQLERKKKYSMFELQPPPLSSEVDSDKGKPKAIVLLPTSELVSQVGGVAKLLSHTVKFRAALISSAYTATVIRNRLFGPASIDILFATPHLLGSIAETEPNVLSRVTHLIIDEADSLFDRSFMKLTTEILERSRPSLRQLVLCSATIPRNLDGYLRHHFPDMQRLVTPNLHAIPRRVQLGVVDVDKEPYRGNKDLACADTIWTIGRSAEEHAVSHGALQKDRIDVKRIIVFVNEREKAVELADYLVSKGIQATALNRDTSEQRQSELLSFFTDSGREKASNPSASDKKTPSSSSASPKKSDEKQSRAARPSPPPSKRSLPNTRVLVMTDLGSRGIDTLAVRHVILYDVPHTTIDFIHRLGRTGRMGKRGRGIVLVGKNDRKDVVREVREGMFKGQALI